MSEKQPSYNQISEQLKKGLGATVLTGRSNGKIETAEYVGKIGENYYVKLSEVDENGDNKLRSIGAHDLSDEGQTALSRELAADRLQSTEQSEKLTETAVEIGHEAVKVALDNALRPERVRPRVELREEDVARSVGELNRALDPKLEAIFYGVASTPEARRASTDPNTGDQEKRAGLENLLRVTIDSIGGEGKLPERVQRNDPNDMKSVADQKLGYDQAKYSPRDYAAKVALAILDGSFRGDPRKLDYSDLPADDPHNGQHRQAALMALDRLMREKMPEGDLSGETSETLAHVRQLLHEVINSSALQDIEAKLLYNQTDPDETMQIVDRLDASLADLYARISRHHGAESESDLRIIDEMLDQLRLPLRTASAAHDELRRWRRFIGEQGNTPGIQRIYVEAADDLRRAILQLKEIQ